MTSVEKKVLVLGATGQQGGATARQLAARGWAVRALVRDPNKPAAQALRNQGIEIVQGNLDDPASVMEAIKGIYGVFSVQAVLNDAEKEVRMGKAVADAAKIEGVSHFVYSSAIGAGRDIGIAVFEAKGKIEQHIQALELPATILHPVMFMDNFRFLSRVIDGQIIIPYLGASDTRVQMISAHDIGVFAAIAFDNPKAYIGKVLEIAGDELTFSQITGVLQKVYGLPVHYQTAPVEQNQNLEDGRKATEFFEREGYKANIESLRQIHPQLLNFESWLRQAHLYS
jgi:uncharacterized protein YbjT (DUF2867 family)